MGELVRIDHHTGIEGPIELAIDAFLATSDFTDATRGVYRGTLQVLADDIEQGTRVREITRAALERHLKERYGQATPATFNRNLATFRSFFDWCVDYERAETNPAAKIKTRKNRRTTASERQARPISYDTLAALWSNETHDRRERCYWAMLYDTGSAMNSRSYGQPQSSDRLSAGACWSGSGAGGRFVVGGRRSYTSGVLEGSRSMRVVISRLNRP